MEAQEIHDYISALVDREFTGLTQEEQETLHRLVHEYPDFFGAYQLDIATKLCVMKHVKKVPCPLTTAASIRESIELLLQSRQASLPNSEPPHA